MATVAASFKPTFVAIGNQKDVHQHDVRRGVSVPKSGAKSPSNLRSAQLSCKLKTAKLVPPKLVARVHYLYMSCTCTQKYGNKVLYGNTVPAFQPSNRSAGVTVFGKWLCGSMVVQMFPFHFWLKIPTCHLLFTFYFLPLLHYQLPTTGTNHTHTAG